MLIDMFGVGGTLVMPTADPRPDASPPTPDSTRDATPDAVPNALPDEAELFQRIFGDSPPQ
ncbi:hypothetical protein CU044_6115 [Streptomyces sp. L-9-10]|uniref:hypothetical protein n=1 Tax=Streptomyces sp. L-9-10 TaxID=1478131 RepID=UPI00101BB638|nr:hypothetical protein [Streptomyces sp. L-9-10]RYJ21965.1 hypothetical protein CU044_6115 [Streptomyces sp. L-9-10]